MLIMIKLVITVLVLVAMYLAARLAAWCFAIVADLISGFLVGCGFNVEGQDNELTLMEKPLYYLMEKATVSAAGSEMKIHKNMTEMYAVDAEKAQKLDNMLIKVLPSRK
jgi:hypothetical protein